MCRMFGLVAASPRTPCEALSAAPRSLRALSTEHPDGWGIAIHDDRRWVVERSVRCAASCDRFTQVAATPSRLIIAHVRKATVGKLSIPNTHPFRRGDFVLAHNGTITDVAALVSRTAPEHRIYDGDTDSERLFGFLLTAIAAAGDTLRGLATGVAMLHAHPSIGSASFLLSDGHKIYAHRLGRTLFTHAHGDATLIASEPLDANWTEIAERTLVVLEPGDSPTMTRRIEPLAA